MVVELAFGIGPVIRSITPLLVAPFPPGLGPHAVVAVATLLDEGPVLRDRDRVGGQQEGGQIQGLLTVPVLVGLDELWVWPAQALTLLLPRTIFAAKADRLKPVILTF